MKNPVLKNASWIIGCRTIQSLLQLAVGMLCARYLGPANYGLLSYAGAVTAFALPLMRLGLNETLVKELTDDPGQDSEIMGTALVLNVLSGLLCLGMVLVTVSVLNRGDRQTILICGLYSLSLFFGALEMIRYWFQYRLLAQYSAGAVLLAYIGASAYRLFLLASGKSIFWFALTNSLDHGLIFLLLAVVYVRKGYGFRFSRIRAGQMLFRSCPYIGASMLLVLFQGTDRIMLTAMAGSHETGLYTAAMTCVTMGQFVYIAIVDSARPVILSCREKEASDRKIALLYGVIVALAAAQGVVFSVGAAWIVTVLYGAAYLSAVPVLRILCGCYLFSCVGLVRNVWILAREKQRYLWLLNFSGAVLNIGLNAWWIPMAGARGAAAASLLTQFFANVLMGWVVKPIRESNALLLRGVCPAFLLKEGHCRLAARWREQEDDHGK